MGKHIVEVTSKADKYVRAIAQLLPNVGGAGASKRHLLCGVANLILLYAVPIWHRYINIKRYRTKLEAVQRRAAIRISSAYRTASTVAIQVVACCIPIHLLLQESEERYRTKMNKKDLRERTLNRWENEWEVEVAKAVWTKKLIKKIEPWFTRKHGLINYQLTQVLTGHGCFGSNLYKIQIWQADHCVYRGLIDTPEHTIWDCERWLEQGNKMYEDVGCAITVGNIVEQMLELQEKWKAIDDTISYIIKTKEQLENM